MNYDLGERLWATYRRVPVWATIALGLLVAGALGAAVLMGILKLVGWLIAGVLA